MRYKKSYLVYLIVLGILLLPGCKATRSIYAEDYKNRGEIRLVEMKDGTIYQIHSGRKIKTFIKDDFLIIQKVEDDSWTLQQGKGDTLSKIPVTEVDHFDVHIISAEKTVYNIFWIILELFSW